MPCVVVLPYTVIYALALHPEPKRGSLVCIQHVGLAVDPVWVIYVRVMASS